MDWATEAAKQVPALAVLCVVVIYFLRYMGQRGEEAERRAVAQAESYAKRLAELMSEQRAESTRTVAELRTALERAVDVISDNTKVVGATQMLIMQEDNRAKLSRPTQ